MLIIFLCVAMLSVNGCRSASTHVSLSPTHYTVSAMMLTVSQAAELRLANVTQSNLEDVVKRRDTITTRLPTLHLLPGETKKVETGKTHIYAIDFDADDNPARHETARDGMTVRSTFSTMQDQQPKLAIAIEHSKIAKWITTPEGNKVPICEIRRVSTTIRANWGEWHNIGKLMANEANKGQVVLVRIDKPNKVSSGS